MHFPRLNNQLTSSSFIRNVAVLGGSNVINQLLVVLSALFLARLYTPADIGMWSVFIASVLILQPLLTLRYESAVVLPKDDSTAVEVALLSCVLTICISFLALISVLRYSSTFSLMISKPQLSDWLWLGVPLLFGSGLSITYNAWLTRQKRFKSAAVALLIKSCVTIGIQITLGYFVGSTYQGLIYGTVIGQIAMSIYLFTEIYRRDWPLLISSYSWGGAIEAARKYVNFPLYNLPYSLIGGLNSRIAILFLGVYFSSIEVGLYAFAFKLTYTPVGLISKSLRQVFFQKSANEFGTTHFENFVRRILMLIIVVTIAPAVVLIFNAQAIFDIVLGPEWAISEKYAIWLVLPSTTLLLTSWLDRLYDVAGRQRLALQLELFYDAIIFLCMIISVRVSNNPETIAAVFGTVTALYNLIWLGVTFWISKFSQETYLQIYGLLLILIIVNTLIYIFVESYIGPLMGAATIIIISTGIGIYLFLNHIKKGN